jgi:H+/Cl- antiporter ClcA
VYFDANREFAQEPMRASQLSQYFSDQRALLPYSLLGVFAGLFSAAAVLAFEWQIEAIGALWMGDGSPDDFESLPAWQRFAIPGGAAILLGAIFSALKPEHRETGIVHVVSRMDSHYGQLPLRNALVQFFGGAVSLGSGLSGGREGPAVHLGAAISSTLAGWLQLPNNSQRIMIACGTAGSIAAAFQTPLAGVVFAMEVIVAEYTVVGFTPVLLSAISATVLSQAITGEFMALQVAATTLSSLWEVPFILLMGVVIGTVTAAFTWLLRQALRLSTWPIWLRFSLVGIGTGCMGLVLPEVMGLGYDSLSLALLGQLAPAMLALLLVGKLVTTAVTVGLGLPVGVIGPSLLIGGCVGGLLGMGGSLILPEYASDFTVYVLIGMGAGMAAMLNAPLAALLAVVELTGNVSLVFPTMLAIVAATLTSTVGLRSRSSLQTVLHHLERTIPDDPISQMLHQTSVVAAMDRHIRVLNHGVGAGELSTADIPNWCLLTREDEPLFLVRGTEVIALTKHLGEQEHIDLVEKDLRRWAITELTPRATLREALDAMRREDAQAVVIRDPRLPGEPGVRGVLTRDIIDQFYLARF